STYLCLVPLPVISHTASYCEVLSVKVDVLPSQTTHFSDTKSCVIGYLHREQCRIVFLFQKVLQHHKLLVVNGRSAVNFSAFVCKQFVFLFLSPPYHILHRVKGNQFLREYRKSERPLQYRREQPQIPFAECLCCCPVGVL